VLRVEEVQDRHPLRVGASESQTKRPAVYCVWAELDLPVTIRPGIYSLRLRSPRSLSNAVSFRVSDAPVVVEVPAPHASPLQSREVRFPVLIAVRLGKPGEVDYYATQPPCVGPRFHLSASPTDHWGTLGSARFDTCVVGDLVKLRDLVRWDVGERDQWIPTQPEIHGDPPVDLEAVLDIRPIEIPAQVYSGVTCPAVRGEALRRCAAVATVAVNIGGLSFRCWGRISAGLSLRPGGFRCGLA
jgi:hypothetical protein